MAETAVFKKKSGRRVHIVDQIMDLLKSDVIYKTIDYRNRSESWIKQYMHQPFINKLKEIYREMSPEQTEKSIERRAKRSLLWESDVNTTINNFLFLGAQHRPDFVVQIDGLRIAVEVKRGESGQSVREGIGQSIVYASEFDFVCYIFVDVSKDKKIRDSLKKAGERYFVKSLWEHYNIRFDVV